jgi:nicotinate-nucleotide pyrophosphorylase (carboxylating)
MIAVNEVLQSKEIDDLIDRALAEDRGSKDVTTESLIPEDVLIEAEWVAKEPCCIAGLFVVERVLEKLNSQIKTFWMTKDGEKIQSGKFGLTVGSAQNILKAERTALNFLQRLSGIATLASRFVEKVQKYGVKILDTRKTTPTFRSLEKYAVRMGGAVNHRMNLEEMVLIKENHQCILEDLGMKDFASLIRAIRQNYPSIEIGIEVTSIHEAQRAAQSGVDFLLLDNMAPDQIREIVKDWKTKVILEASGGIGLDNVEAYASTGVDRISIGALTHSVRSVDISLEVLGIK